MTTRSHCNVTRTQRHPQAAELYANGPHIAARRFEIGDPTLDKETPITADVSLRRHRRRHALDVERVLQRLQRLHLRESRRASGRRRRRSLPVFEYLQDGAKFYGFEAEVIFPLLAASRLSILELRLASDYVRGKLDDGGDLPQIPPLRFGAGLHYERGAWHLGAQAFYYDKQDKTAANELPTDGFTHRRCWT